MTTRHPLTLRILVVLGSAATFSGCFFTECTLEGRASLVVEVRDRLTGMPAAQGATGVSEHASGTLTDLGAFDDELILRGNWNQELPGNHTIVVRKPGFLPDTVHAYVDSDRCHVELETVEARIAPDPRASPEHPVSFIEGPDSSDWIQVSAEVHVYGDTLEISGLVNTRCAALRLVAFRSGSGLHVQVEPPDIPLDCIDARQFEAKFTLPSGPTHLLVTSALSFFPSNFFDGQVRPPEGG